MQAIRATMKRDNQKAYKPRTIFQNPNAEELNSPKNPQISELFLINR